MSEDFKVGDVVCCLSIKPAKKGFLGTSSIKVGGVYRVASLFYDNDWGPCVTLRGIYADTINNGFLASRFRKLPPADPEFIKLIREIKPAKELERV